MTDRVGLRLSTSTRSWAGRIMPLIRASSAVIDAAVRSGRDRPANTSMKTCAGAGVGSDIPISAIAVTPGKNLCNNVPCDISVQAMRVVLR